MLKRFPRYCLGLTLYFALMAGVCEASPLSDLKAEVALLLEQAQSSQALTLLKSQQAAFVADPEFDYLLGTTALEAGELDLAMQAFERAVLVQPSFAGAWVDLAIT